MNIVVFLSNWLCFWADSNSSQAAVFFLFSRLFIALAFIIWIVKHDLVKYEYVNGHI